MKSSEIAARVRAAVLAENTTEANLMSVIAAECSKIDAEERVRVERDIRHAKQARALGIPLDEYRGLMSHECSVLFVAGLDREPK